MGVETRAQAVLGMQTALQGSVFLLLTTHYFKSLGRKVKNFSFEKFDSDQTTGFPPSRLVFRCVWTGLSSLTPPRRFMSRVDRVGCSSPRGPGRRCLPCQPSSRCVQPCSPAPLKAGGCYQTSSLTSFVRCQTQQIFAGDHPALFFFLCIFACPFFW